MEKASRLLSVGKNVVNWIMILVGTDFAVPLFNGFFFSVWLRCRSCGATIFCSPKRFLEWQCVYAMHHWAIYHDRGDIGNLVSLFTAPLIALVGAH